MDTLLINAASGMKARMESLDMLANNIANTGTVGFKADREFYNLYAQQQPLVESQWTDFSQGSVLPTGHPLDLALWGPGFFALNGPSGTLYTRNGSFRVSKTNQLVSAEGYPVRDMLNQGRPIVVDPEQEISIDKSGLVTQGGQELGQLEIDQALAADALSTSSPQTPALQTPVSQVPVLQSNASQAIGKLGNSYFALSSSDATMQAVSGSDVLQGQLEQSNVAVSDSTVRLLSVMRQFEMLQRALNIGAQMNKEAIQDVARVS
jgi:flagellar basal-body rod protein FlgF